MAGHATSSGRPSRWIWVTVGLVLALSLGGGAFVLDHSRVQKNDRARFAEIIQKLKQPAFVLVTGDKIFVDGEPVASTRAVADGDSADWKVAALHRALEASRYRHNMAVEETFHREVALCAAAKTDFKVIKKLLYTCDLAGFGEPSVGILKRPLPADLSRVAAGECDMMELNPGAELDPTSVEGMIRVAVLMGEDGFTFTAGGMREVYSKKAGAHDLDRLKKEFALFRARLPRKDDLTVAVEDGTTAAELMGTLEAADKAGFRHITLQDEAALVRAEAEQAAALKRSEGIDDPSQLGGIVGQGEDGMGRTGTGSAGHGHGRKTTPRVVTGRAVVRGALDRAIIHRIVRRHINEVKYCYQKEIDSAPKLAGRVTIQFTISGSGQVVISEVQKSTLKNRTVEICITRAVRRWLFPEPKGGGIVIVSYPFVLRTAAGK